MILIGIDRESLSPCGLILDLGGTDSERSSCTEVSAKNGAWEPGIKAKKRGVYLRRQFAGESWAVSWRFGTMYVLFFASKTEFTQKTLRYVEVDLI